MEDIIQYVTNKTKHILFIDNRSAIYTSVPSKFILNFRTRQSTLTYTMLLYPELSDNTDLVDSTGIPASFLLADSQHCHIQGCFFIPLNTVDVQLQWNYWDHGEGTELFQIQHQWRPDWNNTCVIPVKAHIKEKMISLHHKDKLTSMDDILFMTILYTQCRQKANRIITDPIHASHKLFYLLLSGK